MPSNRRRPESEFETTATQQGTQTVTLNGLTGGYNNYTSPELMSPQFWANPSANVYSGLHGNVRRARWAPIENAASMPGFANGTRIVSMFSFAPTGAAFPYIILDNGNTGPNRFYPIEMYQYGSTVAVIASVVTVSKNLLLGPYMRYAASPALILQANGLVRSKLFYVTGFNWFVWEFWGLDAPDASPQIVLNNGTTGTISTATRTSNIANITLTGSLPANFVSGAWVTIAGVSDTSFNSPTGVAFQIIQALSTSFTYANIGPNTSGATGGTATCQITQSVGRSYQYAWENPSTGHISAPSPASQFVAYNNQYGTINCIEPGTISTTGTTAVVGTNTNFTSAWVGRSIWAVGAGNLNSGVFVASVSDATHMTMTGATQTVTNAAFQVYDRTQSTNIRLYATGDGQAVYLRIQRNQFNDSATTLAGSGLQFTDTDASAPPNGSFTNEIAQINNLPPPIGSYLQDYQGRVLVFGVPGAPQSFFYSNIETTVVGQPPESFAPLNEITMPVGEALLQGMANLPTGCIIWSNHQDMFKLTGTLTDNQVANPAQLAASIQRLPYRIGCASAYGTAVTSLGAFWLSSDREVWLFTDHYAPKNVGKPIQDLLNASTRISFARMKNYKSGDRNWIALAITTKGNSFNDTLCLLDLDLLASNGQPSFFTFDMATNQPSWYVYNVNCESIEAAVDANGIMHLISGDIDLVTDLDWNGSYYTVTAEQSVPSPVLTLQAIGNEDPEMIKTGRWMRVTTNQQPTNLASQGWNWNILCYDDDKYILGLSPNTVLLVPGVDSPSQVFRLEYSPAVFRFGGLKPVKGRRFQVQCNFPSGPGFYELRGYQLSYDQVVAR